MRTESVTTPRRAAKMDPRQRGRDRADCDCRRRPGARCGDFDCAPDSGRCSRVLDDSTSPGHTGRLRVWQFAYRISVGAVGIHHSWIRALSVGVLPFRAIKFINTRRNHFLGSTHCHHGPTWHVSGDSEPHCALGPDSRQEPSCLGHGNARSALPSVLLGVGGRAQRAAGRASSGRLVDAFSSSQCSADCSSADSSIQLRCPERLSGPGSPGHGIVVCSATCLYRVWR